MRILTALFAAALVCGTVDLAQAYPAGVRASVNMRTGPATRFRVAMVIPRGAVVDVRSCRPAWCQVTFRGRTGFVSRAYLQVRPAPAPRPYAQRPLPPPPPQYDDRDDRYQDDRYGYDDRYGRGGRGGNDDVGYCVAADADWAMGRRATNNILDRMRDDAGADVIRVVGPDDIVTQEFRRDRLTVEVDDRDVIVDLRCG